MNAPAEAAGSYGRLLRVPVLRGLAVADVCARLPQGMVTVTLLLTAAAHASMATAGLVVTGYTLGQAVTGPARGRLADRRGLAVVCVACGVLYAAALLGLLAASMASGPAWLLVAAAAVAGLSCPPLSPGMRSLWSAHAGGPLRQAAFALDAAVFDLAYITGPVLASSLAAGLSPATAVGVLLALTAAATMLISRRSTAVPAAPDVGRALRGRSYLGPLSAPGLRRLLLTGALANLALSATEVALTGYVRLHHALWASGPLLAEVSAGSIAGSLLLGARAAGAGADDERRRLPWMLACYSAGLGLLAAALLQAPLIAVAAPLAGLCLGPTLATLFGLASSAVPGGGTEAQAWLNCAMNGGAAAGAALAGVTAGAPALSLAATAGVAALAAGTAVRQRPPGPPAPWEGLAPRERATGEGLPTPEASKTSPQRSGPTSPTHRLRTRRRRRRPGGLPPARGQWGRDSPMSRGGLGGIAPPEAILWQIFGNSRVMSYRMDFCTLRSPTMRSSKGGRLGGVLASALRAHAPDVVAS